MKSSARARMSRPAGFSTPLTLHTLRKRVDFPLELQQAKRNLHQISQESDGLMVYR